MSNKKERQLLLVEKATVALDSAQIDQAEKDIQECIEIDPAHIPAQVGWILGRIRSRQERFQEALQLLDPLTRIPQLQGYSPLFKELYLVAYYAGDMAKAIAAGEMFIQIDPSDLVFQNELWHRKVIRGLPLSTGIDQLSSFLPILESQPIRTDCPTLYRLSALILITHGRRDQGLAIYLPFFEWAIRRKENRQQWYGYSVVTTMKDLASQSQRFGANDKQLAREFELIRSFLEIGAKDCVADIGGAGGLFSTKIADIAHRVVLTDVSQDLVEKAAIRLRRAKNVDVVCHDITDAPLAERFDKVLMAGVLPVFSSFDAVELALRNVFSMLRQKGRAFISNNYDISSAQTAIKIALDPTNVSSAYSTLHIYENMLWLEVAEIERVAKQIGYSKCVVVNSRTISDGRNLFDFLLVK